MCKYFQRLKVNQDRSNLTLKGEMLDFIIDNIYVNFFIGHINRKQESPWVTQYADLFLNAYESDWFFNFILLIWLHQNKKNLGKTYNFTCCYINDLI